MVARRPGCFRYAVAVCMPERDKTVPVCLNYTGFGPQMA